MNIIEKDGKRVVVLESLVSSATGKAVEIDVSSPEMEDSMRNAAALGRGMADALLRNFSRPYTSCQHQ